MVKIQLRGDTIERWERFNPVIAEREMILIASNPAKPDEYDMFKIGDGKHRYKALPFHGLPAVQLRGDSPIDVMSQKAVTCEFVALEDKLKKIEVNITNSTGNGHKQNTDTGTSNRSFLINDVLLKCCCHDLVLRNACDCDYADLTVKDLYVKGKLYLTGLVYETHTEEVRSKSNMIVLNEGEVGSGVSRGFAGIEIDRGSEDSYYVLFEESSQQLKAGIGKKLYALPLLEGTFKNGEVPTWDEANKAFVPGSGMDKNCMKMEGDFQNGSVPMWDEEKQVFVEKMTEAEGKDYMRMLPPFSNGEIPMWDQEKELFVPGEIERDFMQMEGEIEDGDGVIWDSVQKKFVAGLPYDPMCLRKDRIMVVSSLPTIGMKEGDIIILAEDAPKPPENEETITEKNPYVMKSDIVDNLNTDSNIKVLSARQGYLLSRTEPGTVNWGDVKDFENGFNEAISNI